MLKHIVNWASAYDPLDMPLMTNDDDVPTVSAGKPYNNDNNISKNKLMNW